MAVQWRMQIDVDSALLRPGRLREVARTEGSESEHKKANEEKCRRDCESLAIVLEAPRGAACTRVDVTSVDKVVVRIAWPDAFWPLECTRNTRI